MTSSSSETAQRALELPGQLVIILSGLVGSGKSAFALALEKYFPQFVRCNQDELQSRRNVENLARNCLREGKSVCIDRTNADADQRAHWIQISREVPNVEAWVIVFDIPFEICAERLKARVSHPTIHSAEEGLKVLRRFSGQFNHPHPSEGHARVVYLTPNDQPPRAEFSLEDVEKVLYMLQDSPRIEEALNQPHLDQRGMPHGRRGYNWGRGGYRYSRSESQRGYGRPYSSSRSRGSRGFRGARRPQFWGSSSFPSESHS